MSAHEQILAAAASPKIATAVAAVTTGTGASWLWWVPDDVGKLATLVGVVLSVVLIRVHLMTLEKLRTEVAIMRSKEAERLDGSGRRDTDRKD